MFTKQLISVTYYNKSDVSRFKFYLNNCQIINYEFKYFTRDANNQTKEYIQQPKRTQLHDNYLSIWDYNNNINLKKKKK